MLAGFDSTESRLNIPYILQNIHDAQCQGTLKRGVSGLHWVRFWGTVFLCSLQGMHKGFCVKMFTRRQHSTVSCGDGDGGGGGVGNTTLDIHTTTPITIYSRISVVAPSLSNSAY